MSGLAPARFEPLGHAGQLGGVAAGDRVDEHGPVPGRQLPRFEARGDRRRIEPRRAADRHRLGAIGGPPVAADGEGREQPDQPVGEIAAQGDDGCSSGRVGTEPGEEPDGDVAGQPPPSPPDQPEPFVDELGPFVDEVGDPLDGSLRARRARVDRGRHQERLNRPGAHAGASHHRRARRPVRRVPRPRPPDGARRADHRSGRPAPGAPVDDRPRAAPRSPPDARDRPATTSRRPPAPPRDAARRRPAPAPSRAPLTPSWDRQ